jgi:tetratricopeptide (TPR) repeat protein
LWEVGNRPEAEEQFRKALAIREKLAADFPAVPVYRLHLAGSHSNLGTLLREVGKRPEAEEQFRKALAIQEKLAADFTAVPAYRFELAATHNNLGNLLWNLGKRPEAEEQHRKALAIREKLAANFPAVPKYQVELGGSYCNFGILLDGSGQPSESLGWYEKAIRTLTATYEQDDRLDVAQQFLRNSHVGRARAYDRLKKHAKAVKDWDRAIELSPKAEQPPWRAYRATSRLKAGQVAEAVAEVAELTKSSTWNALQWYDFACVYAVASGKSGNKKQEYADRAMVLLQQAVKAGFQDAAHLAKDTDLDLLRERDDFKKLLAELAK